MVSISFRDGNKGFFERVPKVFVEPGSGCVTVGADALKTSVIAALIDSASFCNGGLETGGIGAENDFGSPVDMTIR